MRAFFCVTLFALLAFASSQAQSPAPVIVQNAAASPTPAAAIAPAA